MGGLAEYQLIETLYESEQTVVYRAYQFGSFDSVVLKTLKANSRQQSRAAAALRREYRLLHRLHSPWLVRALRLERHQKQPMLVLEDIKAPNLAEQMRSALPIDDVLLLAIELAKALDVLAQHHIMHQNLSAENLLWQPQQRRLTLIDFGAAYVGKSYQATPLPSQSLSGTLAYMAPERSGRTPDSVDQRSDFYSVGVLLYFLLSGQLPFVADTPSALLHAMLESPAPPLRQRRRDIPEALNAIVHTLLAKKPAERYSFAYGLRKDLERCLQLWREPESGSPFILGQFDAPRTLQQPSNLYGRDDSLRRLQQLWQSISPTNPVVWLAVQGESGSGKTRVLEAWQQQRRRDNDGYTLFLRCDNQRQLEPYGALWPSLRACLQQLPSQVQQDLATLLAEHARLLRRVLPECRSFLPAQRRQRPSHNSSLALALQQLLVALSSQGRGLSILVDDVLYADVYTLRLLQGLAQRLSRAALDFQQQCSNSASAPAACCMLLFSQQGTLPASSEDSAHAAAPHPDAPPLSRHSASQRPSPRSDQAHLRRGQDAWQQLETCWQQHWGAARSITLSGLAMRSVRAWLAEALACSESEVAALASLLLAKTSGNPRFLWTLLCYCYSRGWIFFDNVADAWHWESGSILASDACQNLEALYEQLLEECSPEQQQLLILASCLGFHLELRSLAQLNRQSPEACAAMLQTLQRYALIVPLKKQRQAVSGAIYYRFASLSLWRRCYALLPEVDRQALHFKIGHVWLEHWSKQLLQERIIAVIAQLYKGLHFVHHVSDRDALAKIAYYASLQCQQREDASSALSYARLGLSLLQRPEDWQRHEGLTMALHHQALAAAHRCHNSELSEQLASQALMRARSPLERLSLYAWRMRAAQQNHDPHKMLLLLQEALEPLGISISAQPQLWDMSLSLLRSNMVLLGRDVSSLKQQAPMPDPLERASLSMMAMMADPCYLSLAEPYSLVLLRALMLLLQKGHSPEAAYVYSAYAWLRGHQGELRIAQDFDRLARDLSQRPEARACHSSLLWWSQLYHQPRYSPFEMSLEPLLQVSCLAYQRGELALVGQSMLTWGWYALFSGKPLPWLEQQLHSQQQYLHSLPYQHSASLQDSLRGHQRLSHFIGYLRGHQAKPSAPNAEKAANDDPNSLEHFSAQLCYYLYASMEQLRPQTDDAPPQIAERIRGSALEPMLLYYYLLNRLANLRSNSLAERRQGVSQLQQAFKTLQRWAQQAPENYAQPYTMLEAERDSCLGRYPRAWHGYQRALADAAMHQRPLLYERLTAWHRSQGQHPQAELSRREALLHYYHWGALHKVQD